MASAQVVALHFSQLPFFGCSFHAVSLPCCDLRCPDPRDRRDRRAHWGLMWSRTQQFQELVAVPRWIWCRRKRWFSTICLLRTCSKSRWIAKIARGQLALVDPKHYDLSINSIGAITDVSQLALDPFLAQRTRFVHYKEGQETLTLHDVWSYCRRHDVLPSQAGQNMA